MKRNNFLRTGGLFWLFVFVAIAANAQKALPCGNGKIKKDADEAAMRYAASAAQNATPNYMVRIFFHIARNTDGTNAALTLEQMATEYATLLAIYAPDNVCFLNCGYNYINSTTINTNFNADDDPDGDALSSYQIPGCINVFYLSTIKGNNTACNPPCGYGGIALGGIPGTFFLVASGNIGAGSTIAHEMGHNLGLLHTFETAYGYENINGDNGSSAADKVADTKADPFAYNGESCYSASNCVYTGNCEDGNGAKNFSPPYTNLMSYWWNCGTYNQVTSNGQFSRVNSFLGSNSDLINCSSPSAVLLTGLAVASGYYFKSALNTMTTLSTVTLSGTVKSVLAAEATTLSPGFTASAAGGGVIQITTRPCN